jgi:Na+/melibiose symporter-like transporter
MTYRKKIWTCLINGAVCVVLLLIVSGVPFIATIGENTKKLLWLITVCSLCVGGITVLMFLHTIFDEYVKRRYPEQYKRINDPSRP